MIIKIENERIEEFLELLKVIDKEHKVVFESSGYYIADRSKYGYSEARKFVPSINKVFIDKEEKVQELKVKVGNAKYHDAISKKIYDAGVLSGAMFTLNESITEIYNKSSVKFEASEEMREKIIQYEFDNIKFNKNLDYNNKSFFSFLYNLNKEDPQASSDYSSLYELYFQYKEKFEDCGITLMHMHSDKYLGGIFNSNHHVDVNINSFYSSLNSFKADIKMRKRIEENKELYSLPGFNNKELNKEDVLLYSLQVISNKLIKDPNCVKDSWGKFTSKILNKYIKHNEKDFYAFLDKPGFKVELKKILDSKLDIENLREWVENNNIFSKNVLDIWEEKKQVYEEMLEINLERLKKSFPNMYLKVGVLKDSFEKEFQTILKDIVPLANSIHVEDILEGSKGLCIKLSSESPIDLNKVKMTVEEIVKDMQTEKCVSDYRGDKEIYSMRCEKIIMKVNMKDLTKEKIKSHKF